MNSGIILIAIGLLFLAVNIQWYCELFEKKQQVEDWERKLDKQEEVLCKK